MVEVRNNNWADVNVYFIRNGARHRIGFVMSQSNRQFELPSAVLSGSGVQLFVDPVGSSETWLSSNIAVAPGDAIRWTIENELSLTSYSVS